MSLEAASPFGMGPLDQTRCSMCPVEVIYERVPDADCTGFKMTYVAKEGGPDIGPLSELLETSGAPQVLLKEVIAKLGAIRRMTF